MNNIDTILQQLRDAPLPPQLARLDGVVLDALAARPVSGAIVRPASMAAIAALVVGIVGGLPGSNGPAAAAAVAPLGTPSPLAPSSLLVGER